MYKSFCKEKDPKTKEYYEKKFKSYLNHVSSLLRKAKDSYYKQYFEDNKKNLRLVWQTIKGIINMKKESDESISSLLIDDEIISFLFYSRKSCKTLIFIYIRTHSHTNTHTCMYMHTYVCIQYMHMRILYIYIMNIPYGEGDRR